MSDTYLRRLVSSFESRPDRVAMRIVGDDREVYTFGRSLDEIRSVAYKIEQEGVGHGDRVALIGENHPCWAIAYLATLYRGAVCVPLDPHGEIETITNFLENSEAKLAFVDSEQAPRLKQIEERLGRPVPAVVWPKYEPSENGDATHDVAALTNGSSNGHFAFADWANASTPDDYKSQIPTAEGKDVALLIYTSGTTGTPKGVPLTHANILAELDGIKDVLELNERERILSLLPLFHAYLQIVNLWVATTYGCEVGYLRELSPAELSSAMKEFKPTILTTVPRLWYLFHKKIFDAVEAKPKAVRTLFSTLLAANGAMRDSLGLNLGPKLFGEVHAGFGGELRLAVTAGSRFDEDVARDFHKLGFTIIQGYGLTETSGAATATRLDDNKVGSVGKPMTGAEVKIAEPDAAGVGEVLIRGGMVFDGYYKNPEANAEAFTDDGWFRSGDLGKFDKDGHLYIVGRGKDVIVLPSGKNVHPEDLEVHYLKTPYVEEMAIIGVADESEARAGAERLIAIVVPDFEYLKQANIANSREIIRYTLDGLGRELPEYQRVRQYIIRTEPLPRTATRKIKRFELKKEFEAGRLDTGFSERRSWEYSDEDNAVLQEPVTQNVISAIRSNSRATEKIHPDMNLEIDLGLDSLSRAETFAALEHRFSTEFSAEEATGALTVRSIVELIKSKAPAKALEENGRATADPEISNALELNWGGIVQNAKPDFPEVNNILRDRPVFVTFAWLVYKVFNLFCRVFMRLEVSGKENLDSLADRRNETGESFLICPNHQSYIDAFVISSNYPHRVFLHIFHVGTSGIFHGRFMEFLAKMLNVVPVDPDTQLMKAMKAGAIGLKAGKILNIYPEGERSFDGHLHDFKKGAAILSTELGLPILPVALDGAHNVWPRGTWRIRPAKVKVRFGTPIFPKNDTSTNGNPAEEYAKLMEQVKGDIRQMIDDMRR